MKIHILEKPTHQAILLIFACLLFCGCKLDKPELLGKWIGKPVENCPNAMFSNGLTAANYEFLKDGVCKVSFEGNNGVEDAIVNFPHAKYELTPDSLILVFTDNVYRRLAFKCDIKDNNNIVLSRNFIDQVNNSSECNSVTTLTRVDT